MSKRNSGTASSQNMVKGAAASAAAKSATRRQPTLDTLRKLFVHSGNCCAFEGCERPIIDRHGNYVAQICHIEAASPGGERFNESMTDDERRDPSNLLLLCYDHHILTNDVTNFTVDRLKSIKAKHEAKYADAAGKIRGEVIDHTKLTSVQMPSNLVGLWAVIGRPPGDEPAEFYLEELRGIAAKLKGLSKPTRQYFCIAVEISKAKSDQARFVALHEIENRASLSIETARGHIHTLLQSQLFSLADNDDETNVERVCIQASPNDWDIWRALKKFCMKKEVELSVFLVDLDFSSVAR